MTDVPRITAGGLYEHIDAGEPVTVADARQPHEYETWHIEGQTVVSISVPDRSLARSDPAEVVDAVVLISDGLFIGSVTRPGLEAGADGASDAAAEPYTTRSTTASSRTPSRR